MEHLVKHGTFTGGCSIMLRRSACPPHGFSAQIPLASDWLFWIETAANGTIGYIDQVLGCYRRHPGSITARRVLTADPLLTLALIDERLPALRSHTRAYRRRYFLRSAAKGYLQRQNRLATRYLTEFLRSLLGLPTAHHAG